MILVVRLIISVLFLIVCKNLFMLIFLDNDLSNVRENFYQTVENAIYFAILLFAMLIVWSIGAKS